MFNVGEKVRPGLNFEPIKVDPKFRSPQKELASRLLESLKGRFRLRWEKMLEDNGQHKINTFFGLRYYRVIMIDQIADEVVLDMHGDEYALWSNVYANLIRILRI